MATYKVLQDIEAEDKLIGPLTLRQFIFALIAAFFGYLNFVVVSKGIPWALTLFVPPMLVAGFFAYPWGRDQPTEVWALAKLRFLLKPKRRIWNQTGIKEVLSITAPKRIERSLTNGLTNDEVQGRLEALSATIDTRGWIVKNVNYNLAAHPGNIASDLTMNSERLLDIELLPEPAAPVTAVAEPDDVLDENTGAVAQKLDTMLQASSQSHRQALIDRMHQPEPAAIAAPSTTQTSDIDVPDFMPAAKATTAPAKPATPDNRWFANQPGYQSELSSDSVTFNTQVISPGASAADLPSIAATPTTEEEQLIRSLNDKAHQTNAQGHLHVINPDSLRESAQRAQQPQVAMPPQPLQAPQTRTPQPAMPAPNYQNFPTPQQSAPSAPQPQPNSSITVTQPVSADILDLARNDDLNIATIQRQANKHKGPAEGEVVISLH